MLRKTVNQEISENREAKFGLVIVLDFLGSNFKISQEHLPFILCKGSLQCVPYLAIEKTE